MQVDSDNIEQLLPQILKHIHNSHFISFDCEFSGLVTQLQRIEGTFPNHLEFYERIKETALNFRIIQLGICAFQLKQDVYMPHVYNFYISPQTYTHGFNNVMVCQVDSMEFLAKNNLDFTRVFKKGIKSDRIYSQDPVQTHQYAKFETISHQNMFLGPEDEENANIIQELLNPLVEDHKKQRIINFKNKTLFNYFKHKYPLMLFDKPKKNMQPMEYNIRIRQGIDTKIELMEEKGNQEKKIEEGETQIETKEKASIRQIISAIIEGGKPIIGHFPNLDLGLIFQTYLRDLPQSYEEFCSQINYLFPWIFDTKVLSRRLQSRLKGLKVDLPSLFKACSNPKLLKNYSNFSIEGLEQYVSKEHEAGYDAFITGCAFIGMANYLNGEGGKVNFENIEAENKLLYSRFSGQVSINGNGYCSNAANYHQTILIQSISKAEYPDWKVAAAALSKYGSLNVHEDHGQIYYVFEKPQKLAEIIYLLPGFHFKGYEHRRIPKARNMYGLMF